jgi:NitT/TauT family transport system ATP-binding protein
MATLAGAPSPAIRMRAVEKIFRATRGTEVRALMPIDLDIGVAEFVSVVGPSGCGKTTLLRIVAGLTLPTAGEVRVSGETVRGPRRDVGVAFQAPALFPWKTVLQNALLPAAVQRLDRDRARERALELVHLVGLEGFENKYPHELSGGMQQRNAIIRALIHDPAILLLDEPFGALDALTREQMNLLLQRVWMESRKTALLITHSIPEAVFLSDRVVVMSQRPGRVLEVIAIPESRPRALGLTATAQYARTVERIRALLGASSEEGAPATLD